MCVYFEKVRVAYMGKEKILTIWLWLRRITHQEHHISYWLTCGFSLFLTYMLLFSEQFVVGKICIIVNELED